MSELDVLSDPTPVLSSACHGALREAWEELNRGLEAGVVRTLRDGREAHRQLVRSAGLDGKAPDDWSDRAERLLEYRRGITNEVLEPLQSAFAGTGPVGDLPRRVSVAVTDCAGACRDLPATVSVPWRAGVLTARASDSVSRRLGKLVARGVSSARKVGRNRRLPLRAVAIRHLHDTVIPTLDREAERALLDWAAWSRQLELAWVEWGDVALPALIQSELPDREDVDALWEAIGDAGKILDSRLEELMSGAFDAFHLDTLERRLAASHDALVADEGVAGSFLFRPRAPTESVPALHRVLRMGPVVEGWAAGTHARMTLYASVLSILSGTTAVQRRLVWRVRERSLASAKVLPEIAAALESLAADFEQSDLPLPERLTELRTNVEEALVPALDAIPKASDVESTVMAGSDSTVEALLGMVRQAPPLLVLRTEEGRRATGARRAETRSIALQDLAGRSFDALRIERIRASTSGLVLAIDGVRRDIDELPDVFAFAYDAAVTELEGGEGDADARAAALATESLSSMAESLRNAVRALETAVGDAHSRLAKEISDGALALSGRLGAGRMQASLLDARSHATRARAWVNETWGPSVDRAFRLLTIGLARLRRSVSRGFRRGTAMVSGPTATNGARAHGFKTLADARSVVSSYPLVYQRLFSFDPLTDGSLMVARSAELTGAMSRWAQWRAGDGVPLIVRGTAGSGVTTFLNVLGSRIEADGGRVRRIALDRRIEAEADLVSLLAEGLELGPMKSFDDLAAAIFEAPNDGLVTAVCVDDLEHVYLRVPGGTNLIERFLTLMAETEPRMFWVGGITESAWQVVTVAEPTAVSQMDVLDLRPLGPEGIRAAATLRHRRSGLPVRFEEPHDGRHLLRRRLRRLRNPVAYDEMVEDDFFSRLERASSGHVRLALFQWLAATDFDQGDGVLMRVPERPDFVLLDSLDLTQNFTLKAFLEHRSLTLEEHDRIFRLPRHESYQIFESLGNRYLIEAVSASNNGRGAARSEIQGKLRYRVRPLIVGAVIRHLRARNIVH